MDTTACDRCGTTQNVGALDDDGDAFCVACVEFFSLALREARVARERDALRVEVQLLRASTLVAVPLSEVDGLRGLPCACDEWGPGHMAGCPNAEPST